jgi:adenylate cyclase
MAEQHVERRLAAVLAADVVGYSRLMASDEEGTLARLNVLRRQFLEPTIAEHRGRIVKRTGDGLLIEFGSAIDATRCAVQTQQGMAKRNENVPADQRIDMRIGIHIGDIIIEEGDIFGDGVNVAARLEGIAQPGGISISEDAWRQVQGKVTANFVDTGEQRLKNIPRPVRVYCLKLDGEGATEPAAAPLPSPEQPSIAVLPFQNMSGDLEQDHFCDGLVEDIITTLSKLAGLRVIARNSSFVYKGRSVDVREAAKQLGVRHILVGSVRKSGNRIRASVQLIDAKDGAHVWAERYDRSIEDIFAIQDEITLILATEMQVRLTEGEQARLRYTTTSNVEAWTYWVQGLSYHHQAIAKENQSSARLCWEKALALDPTSAALNAMLGFIHCLDARFGWWDDREAAIVKAHSYADRALELDPNNADGHIALGVLCLLKERYDEAVAHTRKAVQLAPGSADIANLAGFILALSGCPEEALVLAQKSIALSPNHPTLYLGVLGNAYRLSGQIEEAIAAFEAYNARSPGFGLADLVIAYQENGQPEKSKDAARRLLLARRDFTIAAWLKTQVRRDKARLEADVAALRTAGLAMGECSFSSQKLAHTVGG